MLCDPDRAQNIELNQNFKHVPDVNSNMNQANFGNIEFVSEILNFLSSSL